MNDEGPRSGNYIVMLDQALRGERGEDQKRIAKVGLDWIVQLLKKNKDYGSSVWTLPFFCPGGTVADVILARMSDKAQRIRTLLTANGGPEVDESLDETIGDLGSYCLLYLARPSIERTWAERKADEIYFTEAPILKPFEKGEEPCS